MSLCLALDPNERITAEQRCSTLPHLGAMKGASCLARKWDARGLEVGVFNDGKDTLSIFQRRRSGGSLALRVSLFKDSDFARIVLRSRVDFFCIGMVAEKPHAEIADVAMRCPQRVVSHPA